MTLISPDLPGFMGFWGKEGRVHPHWAVAEMMTRGASPLLTKEKEVVTGPSSSWIDPKSWEVALKEMSGALSCADKGSRAMNSRAKRKEKRFMMMSVIERWYRERRVEKKLFRRSYRKQPLCLRRVRHG